MLEHLRDKLSREDNIEALMSFIGEDRRVFASTKKAPDIPGSLNQFGSFHQDGGLCGGSMGARRSSSMVDIGGLFSAFNSLNHEPTVDFALDLHREGISYWPSIVSSASRSSRNRAPLQSLIKKVTRIGSSVHIITPKLVVYLTTLLFAPSASATAPFSVDYASRSPLSSIEGDNITCTQTLHRCQNELLSVSICLFFLSLKEHILI